MKRKIVGVIILSALLLTILFPGTGIAANDYSYIRVKLVSIGSPSSVTFVVKGAYRIAESSGTDLYPGITYTIKVSGSGLQLSYNNGIGAVTVNLPVTVNFKQYANGSAANYLYVNNPGYGWRNYAGDMQFTRPSGAGTIVMINSVFFETYLYGVVAYEMSNSWPIEALKAQAVCARTYSMKYMKANYSNAYHIGDTSANQVYKGMPLNTDGTVQQNVVNAVDATRGRVITMGAPANMALADGVFSASNGGQIRTANMHWGSTNTYHVFKDDPYDLKNSSSPTFKYVFPVKMDYVSGLSSTDQSKVTTLTGLLKPALVTALKLQKGITCTAGGITITGIKSAAPAVPVPGLPSGSHEYTQVNVTCSITVTYTPAETLQGVVRTTSGSLNIRSQPNASAAVVGAAPNGATLTVLDKNAAAGWYKVQYGSVAGYASSTYIALVTPTATPSTSPTATPTPQPSPTATPSATPTASPAPTPAASDGSGAGATSSGGGASPATFTGDIAVVLHYLNKSSDGDWDTKGELKTAFESFSSLINTSNMWNLYAEKSADGKYLYVVARGYGHGVGMSQRGAQQMANEGKTCNDILNFYYNFDTTNAQLGAVTVTPKALAQIPGGGAAAKYATVVASSITVRAAANTAATAVTTIPKGTKVEILGTSGDWYRALYASKGIVGWVCGKSGSTVYVQPDATPTPKPTASPTPKPTATAAPASTASPAATTAPASSAPAATKTAAPTATKTPAPAATPTASAVTGKANVTSYLSLRSAARTSATCLVRIPKNAEMTILQVYTNVSWLKVTYKGKTGYLLSHYVIAGGNKAYKAGTVQASTLNVRSAAGTSARLLGTLKKDKTVLIVGSAKSGSTVWYKIRYGSGYAYVSSSYIRKQGS